MMNQCFNTTQGIVTFRVASSFMVDVLFIDAEGRVIKIVTMNPWRIQSARGASSVLELSAGAAKFHQLEKGQILWKC